VPFTKKNQLDAIALQVIVSYLRENFVPME
jgi:hypothetical protein